MIRTQKLPSDEDYSDYNNVLPAGVPTNTQLPLGSLFLGVDNQYVMYQAKSSKSKSDSKKSVISEDFFSKFNSILKRSLPKSTDTPENIFIRTIQKRDVSNFVSFSNDDDFDSEPEGKLKNKIHFGAKGYLPHNQIYHLKLKHFVSTGHLCGFKIPEPILTLAPVVEVKFHSSNKLKNIKNLNFELQFMTSKF